MTWASKPFHWGSEAQAHFVPVKTNLLGSPGCFPFSDTSGSLPLLGDSGGLSLWEALCVVSQWSCPTEVKPSKPTPKPPAKPQPASETSSARLRRECEAAKLPVAARSAEANFLLHTFRGPGGGGLLEGHDFGMQHGSRSLSLSVCLFVCLFACLSCVPHLHLLRLLFQAFCLIICWDPKAKSTAGAMRTRTMRDALPF